MNTEHELVALAHAAPSFDAFRERSLDALVEAFDADVALFVALTPRGVERSSRGFDPALFASLVASWDRYAPDVAPVQDAALRDGAATDARVLGARLPRTRVYREVIAPSRGVESLFVVPSLASRKLGYVMLGRRRRPFTDASLADARAFVPALSLACSALGAAASAPAPAAPAVSAAERDLLAYLGLGYTNRQIAEARGTSFFTVRNQLEALYRKLGVANRTEAVGLARRTA